MIANKVIHLLLEKISSTSKYLRLYLKGYDFSERLDIESE